MISVFSRLDRLKHELFKRRVVALDFGVYTDKPLQRDVWLDDGVASIADADG